MQLEDLRVQRAAQAEARLKYLLSQSDIFAHFGAGQHVKNKSNKKPTGRPPKPAAAPLEKDPDCAACGGKRVAHTCSRNRKSTSSSSSAPRSPGHRRAVSSNTLDEDEAAMMAEEEDDDDDMEESAGKINIHTERDTIELKSLLFL